MHSFTHTHTHTHTHAHTHIEWSILKKSNTPNSFDGRCSLCLEEKTQIMMFKLPEKLLNKRSELISRCRHKAKFKLLTNLKKKT